MAALRPVRCYIMINGIMVDPYKEKPGWTKLMVEQLHKHPRDSAERYAYYDGPFTRAFRVNRRAKELMTLARYHVESGREIHIVAHSHGCEIALRAISFGLRVRHLWLIAGASESSFELNGLNKALSLGSVGRVIVLYSRDDFKTGILAALSRFFLTRYSRGDLKLEYGQLGSKGPSEVRYEFGVPGSGLHTSKMAFGIWPNLPDLQGERVIAVDCTPNSHNDYFKDDRFEKLVAAVAA